MKPIALFVVIAVTSAACGTSNAQPQAAQGRGDEAADARPVDPVSVTELQALLPSLPGWQRERPEGERTSSPMNYSDASVRLTNGQEVITVKITDSALNPAFVAPFAMFLAGNYKHETDHGYEKSMTVGNAPGGEKWDSATKSGNVTVVVNKRFVIEVDGSGIPDPTVLHTLIDQIDLNKLGAMK